jgi:general L-amino acid transport system substrate-binding protein
MIGRRLATLLIAALVSVLGSAAFAGPTLDHVRAQDVLTCGITPNVAGFSRQDADGHWRGFDVDICRAIAVAIFGTADKVRFVAADSIEHFLASDEIDVALRGLTWTYGREVGRDLRFGPVVFFDGQGFLIRKRLGVTHAKQLAGRRICVLKGAAEAALTRYFAARRLALRAVLFDDAEAAQAAFFAGACDALSRDGFELAAAQLARSDARLFRILPERLTREPLAPLLRRSDEAFFDIVRWAIFALIDADALGISSRTIDRIDEGGNPDRHGFLHPPEATDFAWGWSTAIVKQVGNYGEIYARNLGVPAGLSAGPNAPASRGGALTAPPLR